MVELGRLRMVCALLREARGARREVLLRRMEQLAAPAREELRGLEHRLGVGMDWLAANAGHPALAEREECWRRWEAEYRAVSDVLAEAQGVANAGEAGCRVGTEETAPAVAGAGRLAMRMADLGDGNSPGRRGVGWRSPGYERGSPGAAPCSTHIG